MLWSNVHFYESFLLFSSFPLCVLNNVPTVGAAELKPIGEVEQACIYKMGRKTLNSTMMGQHLYAVMNAHQSARPVLPWPYLRHYFECISDKGTTRAAALVAVAVVCRSKASVSDENLQPQPQKACVGNVNNLFDLLIMIPSPQQPNEQRSLIQSNISLSFDKLVSLVCPFVSGDRSRESPKNLIKILLYIAK